MKSYLFNYLNDSIAVDADQVNTGRLMPKDTHKTYSDKSLDGKVNGPWKDEELRRLAHQNYKIFSEGEKAT